MMIQIDHRESHDIDLFLNDPQLLPYVKATVAEMQFTLGEATYTGDGSGHLKVAFEGVGEIDFIVTAHMTSQPTKRVELEGRTIQLETVPEIIAKKIRFRGSRIQPRDIFDIAAAVSAGFETDIKAALSLMPEYVALTLKQLDKLSVAYVEKTNSQLMFRATNQQLVSSAYETTHKILKDI